MRHLYNTALNALRPVVAVWSAWQSRDPERRAEWRQRTARDVPAPLPGARWLHGSSVGEARLVNALGEALRRRRPADGIAVSAFTATGRAALPAPPVADRVFFLPLDVPAYVTRVVAALDPASLTLLETEIWPNLIDACHRRGIAVSIVNGRLAPDRMQRYRRYSALYRPVLATLRRIGVQGEGDRERFVELGVREDRIVVTGNLKYDLPVTAVDVGGWRRRLGIDPAREVWVAGSTAEGEDEAILAAHRRLGARKGRKGRPLLILAPRHPKRSDRVAALAERAGLRIVRRSAGDASCAAADVLLLDTLGELGELYALGAVAFVGGSLVPVGGHNLLEPAQRGIPVLFGPHVDHVAEMARALVEVDAAKQIDGAGELSRQVERLLDDRELGRRMGRAGAAWIDSNRGALERSLRLVLDMDGDR